ncbi:MAG TPA: DUF5995 family protein, partial [Longimicrobiaceae bacterium]|nr:DUF5995 family protein [Longimicrobiaceae bacterium]
MHNSGARPQHRATPAATAMTPTIDRMNGLVRAWEEARDRRAVFLGCYALMTGNMLRAVEEGRFRDPEWTGRLLERFASYYFTALEHYECGSEATPAVWTAAHECAREPGSAAVVNLLLGVNAHINYDLVLVTAELLEPEWASLPPELRQVRHADYSAVNAVIAETIDAVQDRVLERHDPGMELADTLLGRLDEWWTARLISSWRGDVWRSAVKLVECAGPAEALRLRGEVEEAAMLRAGLLRR